MVAWLTETLGRGLKYIDAQGAIVRLAGDEIKTRRAIKLPFLDCSTLEKRRLARIALDRDAAPTIYRDAIAVGGERVARRLGAENARAFGLRMGLCYRRGEFGARRRSAQ